MQSITELILLRETGRTKINKVLIIDLQEIPDRKRWQKIIDNICNGCEEKGLMYILRDYCKYYLHFLDSTFNILCITKLCIIQII